MNPRSKLERRKDQRISTPNGLWVSWKHDKDATVSRVQDFSASGAFIAAEETVAAGARLKLLFSVPEGEIKVQAVVRTALAGKGMGVEFVALEEKESQLILKVAKRLTK
ncbi:MAG TPA: PilZ domain-containing protein [Candidatus Dormibacteraeota bacterium]|nr:PilZ domain-containing protein [Candidatus Dormibacteraeota bacterium]